MAPTSQADSSQAPSLSPRRICRTTRPSLRKTTRSQERSTSDNRCELRKTVVPRALRSRITLAHEAAPERVEAGGRLVEEDELGVIEQRLRQADPLLHALAVLAQAPVRGLRELEPAEQLADLVVERPPA